MLFGDRWHTCCHKHCGSYSLIVAYKKIVEILIPRTIETYCLVLNQNHFAIGSVQWSSLCGDEEARPLSDGQERALRSSTLQ